MAKRVSEKLRRIEHAQGDAKHPSVSPAGPREPRVIVIGHKNPDTDSIAAAAGYAELKRQMGVSTASAACAGLPSARTEYLFKKFKVPLPPVLTDVHPRVRDVMDANAPVVHAGHTLLEAMGILQKTRHHRVPVVDARNVYMGMVSLFDIADRLVLQASDAGFDGAGGGLVGREIRTTIAHVQEVLRARPISLYRAGTLESLEVYVGAMSEAALRLRMSRRDCQRVALIVGDREEIHRMAVTQKLRLLIVTGGFPIADDLIEEARSNGVSILQTDLDSATTVRRLRFAGPAELTLQEHVTTFSPEEKLSEIRDAITEEREEVFPVLDEKNQFLGTLSKDYKERELPIKLVLVDHNELSQAVDGAGEVPIIEVLDHHRLGMQATQVPINFLNEVVGSSCTLVTEQYRRWGHTPPPELAGILMGGIITDTLMLRSPTTTPRDEQAINWLKIIANEDPRKLAEEILSVGSSIAALPAMQVITGDKKDYNTEKFTFAVAQVEEVGFENFFRHRNELLKAIKALVAQEDLDFFGLLVTNVVRETSMMLCAGEKRILDRLSYTRLDDHTFRPARRPEPQEAVAAAVAESDVVNTKEGKVPNADGS